MSKEIVTYNDHIYQKLEVEETEPNSGRYKILNRTSMTVYGVLDDEANYNEAEDLVNNFSFSPYKNNIIMVLSGAGIFKVLSTLTSLHEANYKSRFEAVLDVIKEVGFCSEKPYIDNGKIHFDIEKYNGDKDTMYLSGYTNDVIVIGE